MIGPGMPQSAPGHAKHHRNRCAPAIAGLGGIVDELIESGRHKIVELNLADRPHSCESHADADADRGALGKNRIEDAIAELVQQRPQKQKRVAVLAADILAIDERAWIVSQRIANAEHDRFEKSFAFGIEGRSLFDLDPLTRLRHPLPALRGKGRGEGP